MHSLHPKKLLATICGTLEALGALHQGLSLSVRQIINNVNNTGFEVVFIEQVLGLQPAPEVVVPASNSPDDSGMPHQPWHVSKHTGGEGGGCATKAPACG
jgi:hypothetical protein